MRKVINHRESWSFTRCLGGKSGILYLTIQIQAAGSALEYQTVAAGLWSVCAGLPCGADGSWAEGWATREGQPEEACVGKGVPRPDRPACQAENGRPCSLAETAWPGGEETGTREPIG